MGTEPHRFLRQSELAHQEAEYMAATAKLDMQAIELTRRLEEQLVSISSVR